MKCLINIVFCFVLVLPGMSQEKKLWGRPKAQRFFVKNVARQKDPEKLRTALEEAVANTDGRLNIFFALQLGEHYERIGDFANAERVYANALSLTKNSTFKFFKAFLPMGRGTVFDSYDRLGYFYLNTGNLRKAEELFTQSLSAREIFFPRLSVHRIQPIVGMGSLAYKRGDYQKTYEYFSAAQQKLRKATSTHFDYDNVNRLFLNDLAELCMSIGRNGDAAKYIEQLSIASSGAAKFNSKIARRLEFARIFELKARYHLLLGNYEEAQHYLDRADEINPAIELISDVTFKVLKTKALLQWYRGDVTESDKSFSKLVQYYREHISENFVSMSEYEKTQFYRTLKRDFNLFNGYVLENIRSDNQPLVGEMYNNIINTKALLLNETNKIKAQILRGGDAALIGKLQEWEQAKSILASRYFEIQNESSLKELELKVEALEKEIGRSSALFSAQKPHSWKEIQNVLKPGEAAIELVRVNTINRKVKNAYSKNSGLSDSTVYVVLALTAGSESPKYFVIQNGNELEKKFLLYYRNSVFGTIDDKLSYDRFWTPIKKQLSGITKIFLSPDGVFNQLNLNTLRNPSTGAYLLDEVNLVYVTNTADLLREKVADNVATDAVLVGRPSYRITTGTEAPARPNLEAYGLRDAIAEELKGFRDQRFEDLPGTEVEIRQIETELKSKSVAVKLFKGPDAIEENVKSVQGPSILHIATHGFFVEDSANAISPMIRSGVILAGVGNKDRSGKEDGILTAYEATNLNLDKTKLVVLSACQTGVGEIRNGEGVYGLQRAIIVAGAENLLMSLWKVDDVATSQLMVNLYETWDGTNTIDAFRAAQIALRQQYPHPYYWGAFIMLGN
jgi:CHAT domain-containing protein/tetratricopeptide (TPR) repeat protein